MDQNKSPERLPQKSPGLMPGQALQSIHNGHIPALTGVRFFAVFHIFLFHLWSLHDMEPDPQLGDIMASIGNLPPLLVTFISHGYLSTSFFFMLSGFILSYLYWGSDNRFTTEPKRFWLLRFSRLYPIHFIVLLITFILMIGFYIQMQVPTHKIVLSFIATAALVQAWFPPYVPMWSWPTWTLSALLFLYLIMPWLTQRFAGASKKQLVVLLAALPVVSLIPTFIYSFYYPTGTDGGQNLKIFLGSTPIFWIPHFLAGMLLTRLFSINRYSSNWHGDYRFLIAPGDIAIICIIAIACLSNIEEPFKFYLRHGLLMPLYMIIILDLSRNRGLFAKLFALPSCGILGETAFSIFIWQNLIMMFCYIALMINTATRPYLFWGASLLVILISLGSTYNIEKPLSNKLRKKYLDK